MNSLVLFLPLSQVMIKQIFFLLVLPLFLLRFKFVLFQLLNHSIHLFYNVYSSIFLDLISSLKHSGKIILIIFILKPMKKPSAVMQVKRLQIK